MHNAYKGSGNTCAKVVNDTFKVTEIQVMVVKAEGNVHSIRYLKVVKQVSMYQCNIDVLPRVILTHYVGPYKSGNTIML